MHLLNRYVEEGKVCPMVQSCMHMVYLKPLLLVIAPAVGHQPSKVKLARYSTLKEEEEVAKVVEG